MGGRARALFVGATLVAGGCGDEIVGFIPADVGGAEDGSSGDPTAASSESSGGATTTDAGDTDAPGFVGPGCFGDDFDNAVIDPLWNAWVEEDASIAEGAGMLKMTPPTQGVWDTGVVGAHDHGFRFVDGHVRLRVPVPPDPAQPVVLFLQVGDESGATLSILLAGGQVIAVSARDLVDANREEFTPVNYPQWIGIRADGDVAHFETSEDGVAYTALTTHDKLSDFAVGTVLIMTQSYAEVAAPGMVGVDDLEVCVE